MEMINNRYFINFVSLAAHPLLMGFLTYAMLEMGEYGYGMSGRIIAGLVTGGAVLASNGMILHALNMPGISRDFAEKSLKKQLWFMLLISIVCFGLVFGLCVYNGNL